MKQYTFFARDYYSNSGNFSISGVHYSALLQHCFQYSYYFSLVVYNMSSPLVKSLEKCRVAEIPPFLENFSHDHRRIFYFACEESYKIISSNSENLLNDSIQQINSTEDPLFFREDGTLFFEAICHEGEYSLFLQAEENVDDVLKFGHWLAIDDSGVPSSPARDHQLTPERAHIIRTEEFYISLQEIRQAPYRKLTSPTLHALIEFINSYRPQNCRAFPSGINPALSFLPHWYRAFELYILGEFNAMTNVKIIDAFAQSGYDNTNGYIKFFEMLDFYINNICPD